MEKTITRFTPEIRTSIADTIKASGGNEVFFTGRIDRNGVVTEVRVCARGNDSAVPVVQSAAQEADVLIHNHPSGDLTPSNADLSVAARMADYGDRKSVV